MRVDMFHEAWAQHQGVAPFPVAYQEAFPKANFYHASTNEFIRAIMLTKSLDWAHEREWRLVCTARGGVIPLPPGAIDGVILGLRTTEQDRATVYRIAEERAQPLIVLKAVIRENAFGLDFQERIRRETEGSQAGSVGQAP